jgi:hypothetical protein
MENVKMTYDLFIQNALAATSHTVQWLSIRTEDKTYPVFNEDYFLVGTHFSEESPQAGNDKIMLVKVRVPKYGKESKTVVDYSKLNDQWSNI